MRLLILLLLREISGNLEHEVGVLFSEVVPSLKYKSPFSFLAIDPQIWNIPDEDLPIGDIKGLPIVTSIGIRFDTIQWRRGSKFSLEIRIPNPNQDNEKTLGSLSQTPREFWSYWYFSFDKKKKILSINFQSQNPDKENISIILVDCKKVLRKYINRRFLAPIRFLIGGPCKACEKSEAIEGAVSIARRLLAQGRKFPLETSKAKTNKQKELSKWLRKALWKIEDGKENINFAIEFSKHTHFGFDREDPTLATIYINPGFKKHEILLKNVESERSGILPAIVKRNPYIYEDYKVLRLDNFIQIMQITSIDSPITPGWFRRQINKLKNFFKRTKY